MVGSVLATRNGRREWSYLRQHHSLMISTLIAALRQVDTRGRRFERGWRGGDLRTNDEWVQQLQKSGHLLDVPRLAALWRHFVELPRTSPDVMSHGDLTPSNVLVTEGRLTGLLDCGGFGPADPALDLIAGGTSWTTNRGQSSERNLARRVGVGTQQGVGV